MNSGYIIRLLGKVLGLMGLYSADHPVVGRTLSEFDDSINCYLSSNPEFSIGIIEHRLIFEELPVEDAGMIESEMISILENAGIASVTLMHGVSKEETSLLCRAIVSGINDIERYLEENGAVHIRINTTRYAKTKDGEAVGQEKSGEDTAWMGGFHGNSLDSMIRKVISMAVKSPEDQKQVFSIIQEQLKAEIEEKVKSATTALAIEKRQILWELEKLKRDFVSHVTHELRTPLVAVKQAVSIVLDRTAGSINEQQERMLEVVKRNLDRLSKFVTDILDVEKIEAGKLSVNREALDIVNPVNDVLHSLMPWANSKDITLSASVSEDIPYVYADGDRVIQILTNLVGNAIKFTPNGGKVHMTVIPPRIKGDTSQLLKLSVTDTGRGIARDDIIRIFEKFEQAGGMEATDIRGSGLGLSIVRSLVEIHGGNIWVESELGAGSKFTFTLPFYREEDMEEKKTGAENNPAKEKKGLLSRLRLVRI